MQTARLTVGQLADASGVTAKALRHYDRLGLFMPDGVDDGNGYRWYGSDRLPQARLIARLRTVGVPLDAVAECLRADGAPDVVERVLRAHEQRLQSRLTRVRGDLHRTAHLLTDGWETDMTSGSSPLDAPGTLPSSSANDAPAVAGDERKLAAELFNGVWTLMETEDRSAEQDDRMLHMAHASRYHWEQVGTAANLARGEWLCSRVYAVLRRPEPALHHAHRVLEICAAHDIGDWDLAFGYEALARAAMLAGDSATAEDAVGRARGVEIADDQDRDLLLADLATLPTAQDPAGPPRR